MPTETEIKLRVTDVGVVRGRIEQLGYTVKVPLERWNPTNSTTGRIRRFGKSDQILRLRTRGTPFELL